jgi:hypothetical protein
MIAADMDLDWEKLSENGIAAVCGGAHVYGVHVGMEYVACAHV